MQWAVQLKNCIGVYSFYIVTDSINIFIQVYHVLGPHSYPHTLNIHSPLTLAPSSLQTALLLLSYLVCMYACARAHTFIYLFEISH